MRKVLPILLVFLLTTATFSACGNNGTQVEDGPIKVGAIYPLSGSNALFGQQCLDAVRIAVDFINAEGGVQGRLVELHEADAPDPTAAKTEAGRLIDQKGAKILFGSLASGNAMAIASVAEKSDAILVESGGIADALTDSGFQNVFRILDKGGLRGAAGINYTGQVLAEQLEIPVEELKIAIIHEESSYGTSVAAGAVSRAKELGMQIVAQEAYDTSITDMSPLVMRIKQAKPDVLLSVNYIDDAILLVDDLQKYDAMPKVFMGCGAGTTDPNFASRIGAYSDGMFCTDMPTNLSLDVFAGDPELLKAVEDFRAAFLAKHPDMKNVSVAAEAAFAGAYTFLHNILPEAESLDTAHIRQAALNTKLELTALGFGWDLGEDGQNYAAAANINQWQGGEVITVYPEKLQNGEAINIPLPTAKI